MKRSEKAADAILRDLLGRGGFDAWWDEIDEETRDEIRESIAARIRFNMEYV